MSNKYTSLREILTVSLPLPPSPHPSTPPPYSPMMSPAMHGCGSCSEIPIRNPLVKQAALAYLQPMAGTPRGTVVQQGLCGKLKEVCCGQQCGCLEWLQSIVSIDLFGTTRDEEDESDLLMRGRATNGG